jgi:hypothetical protein
METDGLLCSRNARPSFLLAKPHDQNMLPQCAQGRTVLLFPLRAGWGKSAAVPAVLSRETSLTHVQKFMTILENLARKSKKTIGKATAERRGPCSSHKLDRSA